MAVASDVMNPALVLSNTLYPAKAQMDIMSRMMDRSISLAYKIPLNQYWNVKKDIPIQIMGGEYPNVGDGAVGAVGAVGVVAVVVSLAVSAVSAVVSNKVDDDVDDDVDNDDWSEDANKTSNRIYNQPIMNPAKPNKKGTHTVVTNAG